MSMRRVLFFIVACSLLAACQNISCPLDNVVRLRIGVYQYDKPAVVADTLTVTTLPADSILLNRLYHFGSFDLPMHNSGEDVLTDTLALRWDMATDDPEQGSSTLRDTLLITHEGSIHFETIDCPPAVFHQIHSVRYTRHVLDSVSVASPHVQYDKSENIRLHLRPVVE